METERWAIDTAHSSVDFVVRHMVVSKTRGTFNDWSGVIEVNRTHPTASTVTATIAVASITTRDSKRDEHLLSPEFFDVHMYPFITFTSRRVSIDGDQLVVTGDVVIHGITKEIELQVQYNGLNQDPWGNARVHYSARTKLNRKEFGLGWNQMLEAGGLLIGEDVDVEIEIEALRAVAPVDPLATPTPIAVGVETTVL